MATETSVASIYQDGTYATNNPDHGDTLAEWKAGQILRMINRAGLKLETICEVGCGGGGILRELHSKMPDSISFTGIEPMPEAYSHCSLKTQDRLNFLNTTAESITETYDLVLLLDVFEHVDDYIGFLRKLRHLGKHFIFHIPLDMTAQMVLRNEPIMNVRRQVGHLHYFSKDTALATLQYCGYDIQDWFYSDMDGVKNPGWRRTLMRLPRKVLKAISPDFAVRLLGGNPMTVLARPA